MASRKASASLMSARTLVQTIFAPVTAQILFSVRTAMGSKSFIDPVARLTLCPERTSSKSRKMIFSGIFGDPVNFSHRFKDSLHLLQPHHVRSVRWRVVGVLVGFHEHGGNADSDGGAGQVRNHLAVAAGGVALAARALHRVGGVEHDRVAGF